MLVTIISRHERILQLTHMTACVEELQSLVGRIVTSEELESLEKTRMMREEQAKFVSEPREACEIPFPDMRGSRFRDFLLRLKVVNSSGVYVWTYNTIYGGAFQVKSFDELNMEAYFSTCGETISFVTSDVRNALLLDTFVDDDGSRMIDIRTRGDDWLGVVY